MQAEDQATADTAQTEPPKEVAGPESADIVREFTDQLTSHAWVPDAVRPYVEWLTEYRMLSALLIVIAGYLIGRAVVFVFTRVLSQLTRRTRSTFDDHVVLHLRRPIFSLIFYAFLALATIRIGLPDGATMAVIRLLASIVILYWMSAGFPIMALILERAAHWKDRLPFIEDRTLPLFDILCKLLVFLVGTYAILQIWRIDATAWLASAGVIGIAVGFAARDTLANLFSGVFIVADAPYTIGDYINLDSGERGMVTHVGLRSTRILTRDDVEITVPNAVMGGAKIINEAGGRWTKMRVRVKVGVAYGSDVDQVVAVLEDIGKSHENVCPRPEPRVRLRALGDSSLDFELLCWIDEPVLRGKVLHELLMAVYKRLAREGIEIPFPQRDLHVKSLPPGVGETPPAS